MILSNPNDFRLPDDSHRTVVFGSSGNGKTVFMTWLLSHASIDRKPWIIFDYKQDHYLAGIPRAEKIKIGTIPKHAGIYIVNCSFDQNDIVNNYIHAILRKGKIGFFADEGASLPQAEPKYTGLKTLFAQGRSKLTPVLFGTQRPARINKSVRSEGSFYASFRLHNDGDRKVAMEFMPKDVENRLEKYHCHWYDVNNHKLFVLGPVDKNAIMQRFEDRLKIKAKFI